MVRAGEVLENPITGLRTVFRKTAADTNGELLQVNWIGDPGWSAGPAHVHPYQEERFEVLSGRLASYVDGVKRIHEAGEVVVAPAGSVHTVRNAGHGKTNGAGVSRNPFRLALLVHDYEGEIYLSRPPLFVQRVVFGTLARIGRLLGYRAEHPYPHAERAAPPERTESASA